MVHTADHDQARWQPQLCVIATKPWLATTLFGVSLAALLSKIEAHPQYMLIRGRPLPGIDRGSALRRIHANGSADGACFEAAAHSAIMLDFDSIGCPDGFDPVADPQEAVRLAVGLLPSEFCDVSCWWQFTSGAVIKPGIRLRLGFWGSRPTSDAELKAWLPEAVDHALFNPVQPIYVANPIFVEGDDPVPVRSGVFRGERDEVEVPEEFEAPIDARRRALGYAGWRALIGNHSGGDGFNAPIKGAIGAWVGKHGPDHDPTWLRGDIERAIRAADARNHDAAYIEKKIADLDGQIEWTRKREATKPQKQSQAEAVAAIAAGVALFHTPEGDAFVDIEVGGHRETYPVRSKAFKQWLSREYYRENGKPTNSDAIEQALLLTEGQARYDAEEREVYIRVARVGLKVYLDLADKDWRAVEIDAEGWRVVSRPPVRFRRTAGMLPLPSPTACGKIADLRPFLNVDDDGFVLVVAWQLAALGGIGPYPILAIYGEHGAAKTSTGVFGRKVIDPNTLPSRAPPRSDRDLYVAARNSYCIHFENISKLLDWLSDSMCRLATGGGFATRQLYEDADEVFFRGMRPLILDGIENFIERADLADRAIKLKLDEVTDEKRRTGGDLNVKFAEAHPKILGALLDIVAHGLAALPSTRLDAMPRMADFALWLAACEGGPVPWEKGTFRRLYDENREGMLVDTVEGDIVADAVREFMRNRPWTWRLDGTSDPTKHWVGTAGELLGYIVSAAELKTTLQPEWPKNARALGAKLRRIRKGLFKVGIEVTQEEKGDRKVTLRPVEEQSEPGEIEPDGGLL